MENRKLLLLLLLLLFLKKLPNRLTFFFVCLLLFFLSWKPMALLEKKNAKTMLSNNIKNDGDAHQDIKF